MEDINQVEKKSGKQTSRRVFILFTGFPYVLIMILLYVPYISNVEKNFVDATIEFVLGFQVIFGTLIGIFLLLFSAFAYVMHNSDLSRIPRKTSIYESITHPTIQYGPLKLIMPVMEEEIVEEFEMVEIEE